MVAPLLCRFTCATTVFTSPEGDPASMLRRGAGRRRPQVFDSLRNKIFTRRNRSTLDSIDLRMTRTPHAEETTWAEGPELLLDRFMGTAGR
jgi:hypothetical protein